jgi:hypothetical protein
MLISVDEIHEGLDVIAMRHAGLFFAPLQPSSELFALAAMI